MHVTHVVGVDPGIVHTGVVDLLFQPDHHHITVNDTAITGLDPAAVQQWLSQQYGPTPHIFVEGYKPRSHMQHDATMTAGVIELRKQLGATVLLNTGVKKVVKQPLMELLGCWKFSTVTHHQDLRSAARIALLGMLKSEHLNRVLTHVLVDHLEGKTWDVHRQG